VHTPVAETFDDEEERGVPPVSRAYDSHIWPICPQKDAPPISATPADIQHSPYLTNPRTHTIAAHPGVAAHRALQALTDAIFAVRPRMLDLG
jgi:hypothetical protein